MTAAAGVADRARPWLDGPARRCSATGRSSRCSVLLALLVVVIQSSSPGIVAVDWAGVILRAAVPLAILAGCQTLTMLTGGIDLSVGAVASMAGFVTATLVDSPGLAVGDRSSRSSRRRWPALINGIGVGVFRVHPLIMTLGMSLVVLGLANVWQLLMVQTGSGVPPTILRTLGSATVLGILPNSLVVFVPVAAVHPARPAADRLRPAALSRSATTRSRRACPGRARGRSWSCCT